MPARSNDPSVSSVRGVAILGATGSIGRSSLDVLSRLTDRFRVTYLTAKKNLPLLREQIAAHHPLGVVVDSEADAVQLRREFGSTLEVLSGTGGLCTAVQRDEVDIVISALVGFAGLAPTVEAIKRGKTIALANKETLVVAGSLMTDLARKHGASLVPVDSEHSAIFQCLVGEDRGTVAKLFLTASGGPFLHTPVEDFGTLTVEQALNHPNWKMGNKVTIDSATLMNKGLEVIEAHWLFGLPPEKIEVVVHPQSIIHSMVEFVDGSVKAQLGLPDMKLPIQYALTYPERLSMNGGRVSFPKLQSMTFFEPDRKKFPCLSLAFDALRTGGSAPAVLNAANEVAVDAFLNKRIAFSRIPELIERALQSQPVRPIDTLEDVAEADRSARAYVHTILS